MWAEPFETSGSCRFNEWLIEVAWDPVGDPASRPAPRCPETCLCWADEQDRIGGYYE